MKIKTLVIAPYQGLAEIVASLRPELDEFELTIIRGDLEEVLPKLQEMELRNFDLIISRGGTARLIREHSSLPVIEIQVTGYDIMRMLKLIEGYKVPVQMIGFPNIIENVSAISDLMKVYVPYRTVHSEEDAKRAILEAKQNGVMVVVGDAVTVRKAREVGLQVVLITSGREAVLAAFERAKELMHNILLYKNGYEIYKRVVDQSDQGVGIFDKEGELKEANHAFFHILKEQAVVNEKSLNRRISYLKQLIRIFHKGKLSIPQLRISFDAKHAFTLNGDRVQVGGELLYYLVIRPNRSNEDQVKLTYVNDFIETFPNLIMANAEYKEWLRQLQEYGKASNVIALSGERGTGKRLLAGSIDDENLTIEIDIMKVSEISIRFLLGFIEHADKQTTLIINEVDQLDMRMQRSLMQAISNTQLRIVFQFLEDPVILYERRKLNARLFRMIENYTIVIPPLRERIESLEKYIRTFVVMYNEQFGKQIVGIRPDVMQILLKHPWKGNLLEVRDTIKNVVQSVKGEYIEEDVLSLLGCFTDYEDVEEGEWININQTLKEIERDIMKKVMEREGMSMTKAAKRLGINRTTLWRKLKGNL